MGLFQKKKQQQRNTTLQARDYNAQPHGYNKNKRDQCKVALVVVAVILLTQERSFLDMISSAIAILIVKGGTAASTRNLKWMTLSFISFGASLSSFLMMKGYDIVDEDKSYTIRISLWLGAQSIRKGWGTILAFFLFSAFMNSS
jgi:hypothetical protein